MLQETRRIGLLSAGAIIGASQAVMRHLGMRLHENALDEPDWFQLVGILENPGKEELIT